MQVRYVGSADSVFVSALGVTVQQGETVDAGDLAESLLDQPANWQPVKAAKTSTPKEG
jgi:hypothetical protein